MFNPHAIFGSVALAGVTPGQEEITGHSLYAIDGVPEVNSQFNSNHAVYTVNGRAPTNAEYLIDHNLYVIEP